MEGRQSWREAEIRWLSLKSLCLMVQPNDDPDSSMRC